MVNELIALLGAEKVKVDAVSLEAYSKDATPEFQGQPDAVVLAESTDDVVKVIKFANEKNVPVIARGAGSNLCAATVPTSGGIVLALSKMNKILEVSKSEMLAVVQPAVNTLELDLAAAQIDLMYPPDPGSRNVSTIGGNISTCAGGLRGLKYGVTRNYVLGLEIVLGTGEVIKTGGRLVKDVAGYDLTRLFVGSEGTLGVITEATVSLRPRPQFSKYGVAYFDSLENAALAVEEIVASGILPATLEFLDNVCINSVEDYANLGLNRTAGALLLFGDDGDEHTAELNTAQIARICQETQGNISVTRAKDIAEADALLEARRCSLPSLARLKSLSILEDISVSRPMLPLAVKKIEEIAKKYKIVIGTFGHAGDGNLHPTIVVDKNQPTEVAAAHSALAEIFNLAIELGGTITGEHGVGAAKLPYLEARLGKTQMEVLRRVKKTFDPNGILNPGKLGS
jgi:glycolate oxidase